MGYRTAGTSFSERNNGQLQWIMQERAPAAVGRTSVLLCSHILETPLWILMVIKGFV